ncbi:MAG: CAP domain-containing protein, partial [Polyangiaceae bacterium]|nr:CAP domain-containing protein [Polyangiaceae bacterium]
GSGGSATGGTSGSGGSGGSATGGTSGSGGAATGGSGGSGGSATGGSGGSGGSATGGTSGSGGSPTGHYETKTNPGATGSEPGGLIPVCCVPSASEKTAIMQNFDLVNQHRIANGRSALAYDDKLEAAIEAHSHHMATHTFFEHTAPEASVSSPWTRANLCGTSANAENIYYGSANATNAFNAWKNSSGHNANMLNANLKRIGIGLYGTRWGQLFGN